MKITHDKMIQRRPVYPVLTAEIETDGVIAAPKLITPTMAHDAKIVIDRPDVVARAEDAYKRNNLRRCDD